MRPSGLLLGILLLPACVTESQRARPPEPAPLARPDRSADTLREIERQRRWMADAIAARPPDDELQAVRTGDAEAVSDTRRRFRRLLTAVERATWIRDSVPEVLRGSASVDRLVASFDAAGRDRTEALLAADAAAAALAESRSRTALSLDELRKALEISHAARQSEQKLAANLGRAARGTAPDDPLQRLATVPMPPQTPFVEAAARYLDAHPGQDRALDTWPPQLAEERSMIRAAVADLPRPGATDGGIDEGAAGLAGDDAEPPVRGAGTPPAAAAPPAAGSAGAEDSAPAPQGEKSSSVNVSADLKRILSRRGPPLTIGQRPDGLTALRYREMRPCGIDRCAVSVDYLFDANGRLVRSEVVQ